ncbi:NAD(P)/FAD-dependent oxidoreductase, partial [Variovorax sp. E3]|uniref:NAD(P)/FAD-dependent oxidoreductase n=1 Tax=Variovorax sp. E3 TaxID=1914993 RepID=UPI0022B5FB23
LPRVARERALLVGDAAGMVSPVTAGGIHTALQHGERAGAAVARFVRGEADDPATWLVRGYPSFMLKRTLRWASTISRATGCSTICWARRRCGVWRNSSISTARAGRRPEARSERSANQALRWRIAS